MAITLAVRCFELSPSPSCAAITWVLVERVHIITSYLCLSYAHQQTSQSHCNFTSKAHSRWQGACQHACSPLRVKFQHGATTLCDSFGLKVVHSGLVVSRAIKQTQGDAELLVWTWQIRFHRPSPSPPVTSLIRTQMGRRANATFWQVSWGHWGWGASKGMRRWGKSVVWLRRAQSKGAVVVMCCQNRGASQWRVCSWIIGRDVDASSLPSRWILKPQNVMAWEPQPCQTERRYINEAELRLS